MIRVLHVLGGLGTGGTECLIMNWYRNIDRSKVQFDFLVRSKDDNFVEEINNLGGNIYYTSEFPRHILRNFRETNDIIKMGKWDVIHVHGNAAIYMTPLILAKKYNVPCRVMHSHNVEAKKSIYAYIHNFNRCFIPMCATDQLACSSFAGNWMFGQTQYKVLKNGLNIENYVFDSRNRKKIRDEFNLDNKFVIGNVGRFTRQKNHEYLLRIFYQVKKRKPESVLLLVGDGELKEDIIQRAEALGIIDSIILAGKRDDVGNVLSAMDVFVFPSLFEGLGNVLIEAQINGLQCFISSEAITKEVRITANLHEIPLTRCYEEWADEIIAVNDCENNREIDELLLRESGYDIKEVVMNLVNIYEKRLSGEEL